MSHSNISWVDDFNRDIARRITKLIHGIKKDLMDLCEDNDVMREAIEEYFDEEYEDVDD